MKIKKVIIKNYRALEDIEINFNDSMNLIYGANAAGKTSIIQLIHMMSRLYQRSRIPISYQIFENSSFIDTDKSCDLKIIFNNDIEISATRTFQPKHDILNTESEPSPRSIGSFKEEDFSPVEFYEWKSNGKLEDETVISDNRHDNPTENNFKDANIIKISTSSFPPTHRGFVERVAKVFNYEMQMKQENNNLQYQEPILRDFRNALKEINPTFESIMIDYSQEGNPICIEKRGKRLTLGQLSHGEKNIITLLGRICLVKNHPLESLIILIDEIDTSFHPAWQAKIIPILKNAFPNIQFIITSHSPFIWLGADKEDIIHLMKDEEDKTYVADVSYAEGGNLESIAYEYFGLEPYSQVISDKIRDFDQLLASKLFERAEEFITKFEKEYGKENPTLTRLRTRLRITAR